MKVFLIVFGLALLFVIGSAAAMRYFDNAGAKSKSIQKKSDED